MLLTKKTLLPLCAGVMLASCASTQEVNTLSYACNDGSTLGIKWQQDYATISFDEETRRLPQLISASGARYGDGTHEVWEHQGEIRWTVNEAGERLCKPAK